jgi:hypothetical protein
MTTTPLTVEAREPIKVIADIIKTELDLDDLWDKVAQANVPRVMIYNQRFKPPTTDGLYVVLSYVSGVVIGNNNYAADDSDDYFTEYQELAMQELIQIDAMSANDEARIRNKEIIMALTSIYAQQQTDKYLMQLARMPAGFTDLSELEASARMNRYTSRIMIKALYRKAKEVDPYVSIQTPEVQVNV